MAPPEYVIVRKLEYHREGGSDKHLRDIASMLAAGCTLDLGWLGPELAARGLTTIWESLRGAGEREEPRRTNGPDCMPAGLQAARDTKVSSDRKAL